MSEREKAIQYAKESVSEGPHRTIIISNNRTQVMARALLEEVSAREIAEVRLSGQEIRTRLMWKYKNIWLKRALAAEAIDQAKDAVIAAARNADCGCIYHAEVVPCTNAELDDALKNLDALCAK